MSGSGASSGASHGAGNAIEATVEGVFDIILLDPPYAEPPEQVIASAARLLAPGGVLVLEHAKRMAAPDSAAGLARTRQIVSGDSVLSFYAWPP